LILKNGYFVDIKYVYYRKERKEDEMKYNIPEDVALTNPTF
jgi:hypothetical protein